MLISHKVFGTVTCPRVSSCIIKAHNIMSTLLVLLSLSGLLGLTSFGVGILPLSFSFSGEHLTKSRCTRPSHMIEGVHMSRLSSLGTGLLLGAALGVIIPEYVCELSSHCSTSPTIACLTSFLQGRRSPRAQSAIDDDAGRSLGRPTAPLRLHLHARRGAAEFISRPRPPAPAQACNSARPSPPPRRRSLARLCL